MKINLKMKAMKKNNFNENNKNRASELCTNYACHVLDCQRWAGAVTNESAIQQLVPSFSDSLKNFKREMREFYVDEIKNILRYIHRSQLLVINFETLVKNSSDSLRRIAWHFDVPRDVTLARHGGEQELSQANVGQTPARYDCKSKDFLDDYFRESNQRLYQFMGQGGGPIDEPLFPPFKSQVICDD
jgi:hypothetical protein